MANAVATVFVLGIWFAAGVADLWISSLATLRLYRGLRRRAIPVVLGGVLSALAWWGIFTLGWLFVGLWWALRKLGRRPLADGLADG